MQFRFMLAASVAGLSAAMATPAAAQSTGSVDFEDSVIVVSGERQADIGGVELPPTPKAKQVISEELIRAQRPGQTVNDIVNLVPGVNFQNNDPWGSGGGSFTIRGFSSDRISQTLDGVPLNDSGNYALYTNQQVDPEILSQINVNLGSTDVDSPTASASGGTINIRTREPSDAFGITTTMSIGDIFAKGNGASDRDRLYMRGFGMIDTGDLTGMGTKAFVSASFSRYNNPFNNYGKNQKEQYNGRIWQDIGSNGDFVAIAGHYNRNRNNFFGSFALDKFPKTKKDRFYDINYPCQIDVPQAGVADLPNSCGTEFDRRYNPSDTGNIRGASRFTLTDGLVLTIDPSYQYVKANGGGTVTAYESGRTIGGRTYYGYFDRNPYTGVDLNGDGDLRDQVTVLAPSQTRTKRYAVISNLAYEINEDHSVRVSYTYEHANHRQTGQVGLLQANGEPFDVFPVDDPVVDANGNVLQKRDRKSFAILNQVSGEYRGTFGDLTAVLGVRAPFFKRKLDQNCFTISGSGSLYCVYDTNLTPLTNANPGYAVPQKRTYKYDKVLPNIGFTYDLGAASVFGNYSKGMQVPSTDNLYQSIYYANANAAAHPKPETTDNFDLGARYQTGKIQAMLTGWYTRYSNRLASAYDPDLDRNIYRNLGRVDKYGIDASLSWSASDNFILYVFGSVMKSKIKEDVLGGSCSISGGVVQNQIYGCTAASAATGTDFYLETKGKWESGAPKYSFGGRAQYRSGPFEIGLQAKRTGERYVNDENRPIFASGAAAPSGANILHSAKVDGFTLIDLDARWNIGDTPWGTKTAVQLNVSNLLDEFYVGGFGGSSNATAKPNVQIGAPRAASLSFIVGF